MRHLEYLYYERLDDWVEDDVVLVEIIDSETGNVRTHYPNRQSGPQPIEEALDEAQRICNQDPNITRSGVLLVDDVEWSPVWGALIKSR